MRPIIITRFASHFLFLLYHPFAFCYDCVAAIVSFGQWKNWTFSVTPFIQGKKILELGFGPGHLQNHLQSREYQVFGIDKSRQMLKIASKRITVKQSSCFAETAPAILRGDAQNIPFQSDIFDTVVATFPTEYIFDTNTLKNIDRVLKKDGVFVILLAAFPVEKPFGAKMLKTLYQLTGQVPDEPDKTINEFQNRLENTGFSAKGEWINTNLARLLLITARKKIKLDRNCFRNYKILK